MNISGLIKNDIKIRGKYVKNRWEKKVKRRVKIWKCVFEPKKTEIREKNIIKTTFTKRWFHEDKSYLNLIKISHDNEPLKLKHLSRDHQTFPTLHKTSLWSHEEVLDV